MNTFKILNNSKALVNEAETLHSHLDTLTDAVAANIVAPKPCTMLTLLC